MSITYTYDFVDFTSLDASVSSPVGTLLTDEVIASGLTGLEDILVLIGDDTVDFTFASAITQATLDTVVADHTGLNASGDPPTAQNADLDIWWLDPVKSNSVFTPPSTPATGDRYIIAATATGDWTGKEDSIAEWRGNEWAYTTARNCMAVHVVDTTFYYYYDVNVWKLLPTVHSSRHQHGGDDEISTATPGANAIPKADGTGKLASGWIPGGADSSAIHDDVSGEIDAITEKSTPVSGDWILIEDSESSNVKKKVQVGNVANVMVDEDKVIYVGKHGSNSNDGKNIENAVLTFTYALSLISAQTPSSSNIWGIVCLDGGIYAENITFTDSFVHMFAANAVVQGSIVILDDCSFELECLECTSGTALTKSSGSGTAYASLKKLDTDGCDGINNSSSGVLNVEVEFYTQTAGVGLQGTAGISHADIQDWDLYGASPVAIKTTAGTLNLRSANIADRGGSGTSIGFDCDGGTTNALAVYVSTDKCLDVEIGATLNLIVADCSGTQENAGTLNLTTASTPAAHALGSHTSDTLANLNSIISDATLIDTGDSRLSDSRTCDNTFDNATTSRTNLDVYSTSEVDGKVAGLYDHKGAYNASTNTPDLDTSPSGIKKGDAYTVSVAGTFFTEATEVGDVLIADQDDPTLLTHWTRVNKNISFGTTSGTACEGDDSRLSDARTPTSHTHVMADVTDAGDAATRNTGQTSGSVPKVGTGGISNNEVLVSNGAGNVESEVKATAFNKAFGSGSGTVCEGDDSRLSDARTPTGSAGGDLSGTYPNPTVTNGVTASANITDNRIVRGDGGAKGIHHSDWEIADTGKMSVTKSLQDYIFDIANSQTGAGGQVGRGFRICGGENLGEIAFHVCDADDSFQIMEMESDQGHVTMGKTYAQTLTDNGVVYGLDIQHSGVSEDFNTQNGNYRIGGKIQFFRPHSFPADSLDSPNNADWKVNAFAALAADSNNAALTVRRFDDTTEEGVGFSLNVPLGATELKIKLKSRAETGPGSAKTVLTKLYQRGIPDNAAVEAWSSGVALASLNMPITTEYFQYDEETITLSTLGITAGRFYQFEFTRLGTGTLTGDWTLLDLEVEFH